MDKKALSSAVLSMEGDLFVTLHKKDNYLEVTNTHGPIFSQMRMRDGKPIMTDLLDRYGTFIYDPEELERHRVLAEQHVYLLE